MKIKFVVGSLNNKVVASTWEEIKKYEGDYQISNETYLKFKALEFNKDFEKEILKSRKALGIPKDGYEWKYYETMDINDENTNNELRKLCNKILAIDNVIGCNIKELLYTNCVQPNCFVTKKEDIWFWFDDQDIDSEIPESVMISIQKPITQNRLISYIKSNWNGENGIGEKLKKLCLDNRFYISERDLRIVEIKYNNSKTTYRDIADTIIKEFNVDDTDSKINEFSIKVAHDRALKKIQSLVKRRK